MLEKNGFFIENGVLEAYLGNDTHLVIPSEVKRIRHRAFCARRNNIYSIVFDEGFLEVLASENSGHDPICDYRHFAGEYGFPFQNCGIDEPLDVCEKCNEYGIEAFSHLSKLQSISFPASLKTLESCFDDCPSLMEISVNADNNFFEVIHGGLYNKEKTFFFRMPPASKVLNLKLLSSVKTVKDGAFVGCGNLESIELPNGITELGSFSDCVSLQSITLPSTLNTLGGFKNCVSLKELVLPQGLRIIKDEAAFQGCKALREIVIPQSVEYTAYALFKDSGINRVLAPTHFAKNRYKHCFYGFDGEIVYY